MATLKYRDANGNYVAIPTLQGPAGNGISTIKQTTSTTTSGGKNVVTVTMSNGTTSTFNVYNGAKGDKGDKGDNYGEGIYLPLTGGVISKDLYIRHTGYTKGGTLPSSDATRRISFIDNSGETASASRLGMIYHVLSTSGDSQIRMYAYSSAEASTANAYIYVKYANDGTTEAGCSSNLVFKGACWNDYAEYREASVTEPGRVVCEVGDDTLVLTSNRMTPACSIVSDTFGFAIGETDKCKTPLAQAGRVLAYPLEDRNSYKPGDAVCSGPNGTISKMTQEEKINHPECIIGYVSCVPQYETWGENNTQVNNRIWIKVI